MSRITNIQPKNNTLEKENIVEAKYTEFSEVSHKTENEIKKKVFRQAFNNALSIEESRKRTLKHIDELWEKSK